MKKRVWLPEINGASFVVKDITKRQLPECVQQNIFINDVNCYYRVDFGSTIALYMGKNTENPGRPQYVVWYPNGEFYVGFGLTIAEAIENALKDAWMYIKKGE